MEIFMTDVAAARIGAAFSGVRSPWVSPAVAYAAGPNHARTQNPILAAGSPETHRAAFRTVPAMGQQLAVMADEPLAVNGNRKQNVHKTRMNAGGYGAMGPHPEREPA